MLTRVRAKNISFADPKDAHPVKSWLFAYSSLPQLSVPLGSLTVREDSTVSRRCRLATWK